MSIYPLVSECCGAAVRGNSDDIGICSECKEHCEYGYRDCDGNFFETMDEAVESDKLLNQNK